MSYRLFVFELSRKMFYTLKVKKGKLAMVCLRIPNVLIALSKSCHSEMLSLS